MLNNRPTELNDSVALETEEVVNGHSRSLQTDEPEVFADVRKKTQLVTERNI